MRAITSTWWSFTLNIILARRFTHNRPCRRRGRLAERGRDNGGVLAPLCNIPIYRRPFRHRAKSAIIAYSGRKTAAHWSQLRRSAIGAGKTRRRYRWQDNPIPKAPGCAPAVSAEAVISCSGIRSGLDLYRPVCRISKPRESNSAPSEMRIRQRRESERADASLARERLRSDHHRVNPLAAPTAGRRPAFSPHCRYCVAPAASALRRGPRARHRPTAGCARKSRPSRSRARWRFSRRRPFRDRFRGP